MKMAEGNETCDAGAQTLMGGEDVAAAVLDAVDTHLEAVPDKNALPAPPGTRTILLSSPLAEPPLAAAAALLADRSSCFCSAFAIDRSLACAFASALASRCASLRASTASPISTTCDAICIAARLALGLLGAAARCASAEGGPTTAAVAALEGAVTALRTDTLFDLCAPAAHDASIIEPSPHAKTPRGKGHARPVPCLDAPPHAPALPAGPASPLAALSLSARGVQHRLVRSPRMLPVASSTRELTFRQHSRVPSPPPACSRSRARL